MLITSNYNAEMLFDAPKIIYSLKMAWTRLLHCLNSRFMERSTANNKIVKTVMFSLYECFTLIPSLWFFFQLCEETVTDLIYNVKSGCFPQQKDVQWLIFEMCVPNFFLFTYIQIISSACFNESNYRKGLLAKLIVL